MCDNTKHTNIHAINSFVLVWASCTYLLATFSENGPVCHQHVGVCFLFVRGVTGYLGGFKILLQIFFTKLLYNDIVIPTDHNLCSSLIGIWQKDRYLSEFVRGVTVRGVTLLLRNTTDSLGYRRSCPFTLGVQLHARRPRCLMTVQLLVIT